MKRNSLYAGRFALTGAALAAMCLVASNAWALGLGRLAVKSALGENLRAEIDVTSLTPEEASNLDIRIAPPESYRAAGVDYNAVLPGTRAVLQRYADGRPYLSVTSDRAVQEPFVDVILEITWSSGRLVREYTLLLDPPVTRTATSPIPPPAPEPVASPIFTPAPVAPPPPPAPRVTERRAAPVPRATTPAESPPAEPRRPAPAPRAAIDPAAGDYTVRRGDSLSGIASRVPRQGVSLDQMLAALYQANPDAFINSNINRLKAGVVLSLPSPDSAKSMTPSEARRLIQAQSVDFGAYRQRLAAAAPEAQGDGPARQASGTVQSSVEDGRSAASPAPDKLTLSKGAGPQASAPEVQLSRERESQEASARVAELSKNVDELRKLSSASAAASGKPPSAVPALPAVTPPVAAAPVAEAPASAPEAAQAEAAAPAASALADAASEPVVAAVPPAAPASLPKLVPVPAQDEPASIASMVEENPLILAAVAALIALLAGFGIYRFTKRAKKDSGETSFLESRLQPDSFFGASGGQRIDTRDAGGTSSSMSYSLSQLDAIGDVDPVAEADVYLAYGRDLQAEEILKEAMRASPERLAIRTKLLEVYAKRRDTKGFELLATQLYGLTGGQGEDWAKAQEIGSQIDPENPLYQPDGKPSAGELDGGRPTAELLGASTMPQSILPSPSEFGASSGSTADFGPSTGSGIDLDLDLGASEPAPEPAVPFDQRTQPQPPTDTSQNEPLLGTVNFDLSPAPSPATSAKPDAPASGSMDFDLGDISLDLGGDDLPADPPKASAAPEAAADDFATVDLGEVVDDGSDPIARKLELAEEFRQIGDTEGARDLLQEVVAKSSGTTKSRAQAMLSELG